jgi:hypothetical protein
MNGEEQRYLVTLHTYKVTKQTYKNTKYYIPLNEHSVNICFTNTDQLIKTWRKKVHFF